MINGQVTPDREAVIRLTLRGPSGQEVEVDAVLDTGFTEYLSLPPAVVRTLQLPYRASTQFTLADGSIVSLDIFRVMVLWDGQSRVVPVLAAAGGALIGMALVYGSRVTLNVVDGGPVNIEALP